MIIHNHSDINNVSSGNKPILFMFPFAGGNTYSYRGFIESLETKYDLVCIELPGRNNLLQYELKDDMDELTDFIVEKWIYPARLERSYIFYGHSMGGILSYLITKKLQHENIKLPSHIIISGCAAPSVVREKKVHLLPSPEFWIELENKGGVPDIILQHKEFKEYLEPIIKSDFKAIENYIYQSTNPVNIDMTVMFGSEEEISQKSLIKWEIETIKKPVFLEFSGKHFFLFHHKSEIINYLKSIL